MGIFQGQLYVRTRTVQVESGMSIDSHPESCILVQTASPYSPGMYVNWNLSLDQNAALQMGINGHTRLDLYSSCTDVQLTLKNSHS